MVTATGASPMNNLRMFDVFRPLLSGSDVNRSGTKCTEAAASCQRSDGKTAKTSAPARADFAALSPQAGANVGFLQEGGYRPYAMADVMRASAARKFTAISTFAGGGGSSTGYRLAGGRVLLVNEFVPEAARTYAINFPDCVVDQRDIRKISTTSSFLARCRLRQRISAAKPDGDAGAVGLDCTSPACEHLTF